MNIEHPLLYQINTRVWMTELGKQLGRVVSLDDVPDFELDRIAEAGFQFVWLLSVWQTGVAGQTVSRENAAWRSEFKATLSDLVEDDIAGSGFAITAYEVSSDLGGPAALARLRERLRRRGLQLILDFVPNHTALDHEWVSEHPEFYISGSAEDLVRHPENYTRVRTGKGERILAYGRDPYFAGWPDTLQLDYANAATQKAMIAELVKVADQCDGVRCDMAMLVLPEVFERTWGKPTTPFWDEAVRKVRSKLPDFCFIAEVYWDMEWTLQQLGFNYTYDKRLYDRLRAGSAVAVRDHFRAELAYQNRMARFLENHDEPRAATTFSDQIHVAAAVLTYLAPGMRFFQRGQLEGYRVKVSPHLVRAPEEPVNSFLKDFYTTLLNVLQEPLLHTGKWTLLESRPAWDGNWTSQCFINFIWSDGEDRAMVISVNYAPHQSQCYLPLPLGGDGAECWLLQDQFGNGTYERSQQELTEGGLFLDVPAWRAHVFLLAHASRSEKDVSRVSAELTA